MGRLNKLGRILAGMAVVAAGVGISDADEDAFTRPPRRLVREAHEAVAAPRLATPSEIGAMMRGTMTEDALRPRGEALPDFAAYSDVETRKTRFFSFLLPLVVRENGRLLEMRQRLAYLREVARWGRTPDLQDQVWLEQVVGEFRMRPDDAAAADDPAFWNTLLRRVDALPVSLVLVQAANESAWGTSRFAREGNNLFGQWCFRQGCGIVPEQRSDGAMHEVARFRSVGESVGSYMHNLNTGRAYRKLREIRASLRRQEKRPDALELAAGLIAYSERGDEYIDDLRLMIRQNRDVIAAVVETGDDTGEY